MPPPDRYVDVELLEAEEEPDRAEEHSATGVPPWRRRLWPAEGWSRRRWTAGVVVLALALAVAVVAQDGSVTARSARLERAVGLVTDLGRPLVEAWRVPGGYPLGVVGDVVLTSTADGGGAQALAAADGTVRWRSPDDGGSCQLLVRPGVEARRFGYGWPSVGELGTEHVRVLCVGSTVVGPSWSATRRSAARVLDVATGEQLAAVSVDSATASSWVVEEDVVLSGTDASGRWTALRWSPWTGRTGWVHRSAEPVVDPGGPMPWSDVSQTWMRVGGSHPDAISLVTGESLDPSVPPSAVSWVAEPVTSTLPGGVRVVAVPGADGASYVEVRDPAGAVRFTTPGEPLVAPVDDLSVPDLLVVRRPRDGALAGVDLLGGSVRWQSPRPSPYTWPLARADGTLLLTDGTDVVAIDLRDGAELWRVDPGDAGPSGIVTDGSLVLVAEPDVAAPALVSLVARGARDGLERWRQGAPGRQSFLAALRDGSVLVVTGSQVVALRPPPSRQ
ncbi:MAG TPA: PQQ-binding-like beta-propeller repeat protein [Actinotalea sp.]|nr:PQQ-binding-like beta-propeller repeat protein [Actinotalea sp.]